MLKPISLVWSTHVTIDFCRPWWCFLSFVVVAFLIYEIHDRCHRVDAHTPQLMCASLGWWFISLANAAFWWAHAMLDVYKPWLILQSLVDIFWSKRTSLGWCCLLVSMVMSRSWCTQATGNVCMPLIMMHEIFWRRLQNLNKPCKMQKTIVDATYNRLMSPSRCMLATTEVT